MKTRILSIFSIAVLTASSLHAEEDLLIKRATVSNFLSDPIVLGNVSQADDVTNSLPSTFIITLPSTGQEIYWSPAVCRLISIKKGNRASFDEMIAEGPHPLAFSLGAIGKPKYFGFRIVEGLPEFLYTYGQLSIEEKFSFSDDGRKVLQTYKIVSNAIDGAFSVPEKLRKMVTANNGKWSNNVLMLKRDELKEGFTVTYHLDPTQLR